jgi:hypothetical protein
MAAWVDLLFTLTDQRRRHKSKILGRHFVEWLTSWAPVPTVHQRWSEINQKMILLFSDHLIATGIAVLVAGIAIHPTLSVYHFQLVTWQAWLASNSHQVALTVLQHYLRSHKIVLYVRIIRMTVVFIFLFVAIIYAGPAASGNCSALQYFDTKVDDTWTSECLGSLSSDVVISLSLLTVSYFARLLTVFERSAQWSQTWFRQKPGSWLRKLYDHSADGGNKLGGTSLPSACSPFTALGEQFATCTGLESSSCSGSRVVSHSAAPKSSRGATRHPRDTERTTGRSAEFWQS